MTLERDFDQRLLEKGISRRDFMKYCGFLTATMGLASSFVPRVAEVFAAPKQRPPVIWLHFAECTGCSEAVLRSMYPWIDESPYGNEKIRGRIHLRRGRRNLH